MKNLFLIIFILLSFVSLFSYEKKQKNINHLSLKKENNNLKFKNKISLKNNIDKSTKLNKKNDYLIEEKNKIEDISVSIIMGDNSSGKINKIILFENISEDLNLDEDQLISTIQNIKEIKRISRKYLYLDYGESVCKNIKNDLTSFFYNEGYKFFAIQCLEKNKKLDVTIIFAYIGNIEVVNNKYFSKEKILSKISLKTNQMVKPEIIEKDIFWLNNNPFRSVSAIYTPGENFGTTNIILDVQDRRLLRLYSGYEMTDNNIAGHSRFFVGANYGNLFNMDQQINYQFICSPKIQNFYGHSASYIIPLPWRNLIKMYGSYVHSKPKNDNPEIINKGRNYYFSGNYVIPFVTKEAYKHSVALGYNYQNVNNFFEYFKQTFKKIRIDISQFFLSYEVIKDINGNTVKFDIRNYYSPGDMTKHNSTEYFKDERKGAKSNYFYSVLHFESMIHLKNKLFWFSSMKGQLSSTKLMPTEELSLGGFNSVRGYKENAIIGDYGFLLNNELRLTDMSLFNKKNDQLVFLIFWDYGFAKQIDENLLGRKSSWLMSIGPGMRYNINENLNFRLDYGIRLNKIFDNESNQVHLQLMLAY